MNVRAPSLHARSAAAWKSLRDFRTALLALPM